MEPTKPATPDAKAEKAKTKRLMVVTGALVLVGLVVGSMMLWTAMNNQAEEETPTASITITTDGVTPATLKVSKGQDVTWINNDDKPHMVVGDEGSPAGFKSEEALGKGDSYTFTFEESGTFNYHDAPDIARKGVIVVE